MSRPVKRARISQKQKRAAEQQARKTLEIAAFVLMTLWVIAIAVGIL